MMSDVDMAPPTPAAQSTVSGGAGVGAVLPPQMANFEVEQTGPLKTRVNTRATLAERSMDRFVLANSHRRQQSASQLLKTLANTSSGMTMRSRMMTMENNNNNNDSKSGGKKKLETELRTEAASTQGSSFQFGRVLNSQVPSSSSPQQRSWKNGNQNITAAAGGASAQRTHAITWDADALGAETEETQSITSTSTPPSNQQQQQTAELEALKLFSTTAAAESATTTDFRDRPFAAPVTWGTSAFLQKRNCGTTHVAAYNRKAVEHGAAERLNATNKRTLRLQQEKSGGDGDDNDGDHDVQNTQMAATTNAAASTNYPLTTYQQSQLALLSIPDPNDPQQQQQGGEQLLDKDATEKSQNEKLTRDFFSTARKIERADDDSRSGRVGHQQRAVDILNKRSTDPVMQPREIQFYSSPIVAMERLSVKQEREKLNCLDLVSCARPKPNSEYKMDFFEAPEERLEDLMDNVPEGSQQLQQASAGTGGGQGMMTTFASKGEEEGTTTKTTTTYTNVECMNDDCDGDELKDESTKPNATQKSVRFHSSVKGGAGSPTMGEKNSLDTTNKNTTISTTNNNNNNNNNHHSINTRSHGNGPSASTLSNSQQKSSSSSGNQAAAAVPTCFFPNAIKKTMADFALLASSSAAAAESTMPADASLLSSSQSPSSSRAAAASPNQNWTRWSNSVVEKRTAHQQQEGNTISTSMAEKDLGDVVDFYASQMQTKFQPNANDASYEDYNFQRRAITNASTTFPLALGTAKQSSTSIPKYAGFMPSSVRNVVQQQSGGNGGNGGTGVWAAKADVRTVDINASLHMGRPLPISSACISYAQQAQRQEPQSQSQSQQRRLADSASSSMNANSTASAGSSVLTSVVRDAYDEESRDILRDFSNSYMTLAVHGDVIDAGRSMSRSVQGKRFGGVAAKPLKPRREEDIQKTVEGSMLQNVLHAVHIAGDTLTTKQVKRAIF